MSDQPERTLRSSHGISVVLRKCCVIRLRQIGCFTAARFARGDVDAASVAVEHWFNIAVDQGSSAEAVAKAALEISDFASDIGFCARSSLADGC